MLETLNHVVYGASDSFDVMVDLSHFVRICLPFNHSRIDIDRSIWILLVASVLSTSSILSWSSNSDDEGWRNREPYWSNSQVV